MSWVDAVVLVWVALSAFVGYQRGLTAQFLSLVGLAIGGVVGAWIGPLFLAGGRASPWVPLASLAGALVGALLVQTAASVLGARIRSRLVTKSPLRVADVTGGVVLGSALGLAIAWLAAVAVLQLDRPQLRTAVRSSAILDGLVDAVPPRSVLRTLARLDPLPLIAAPPDLRLPPPDPSVLENPLARRAGRSVVKIEVLACGIGLQGSGWVVRRGVVATNVHVVAGADEVVIVAPNGQVVTAAVVYVDPIDDVALLRAPELQSPPIALARRLLDDERVVLLGYPRDGPLVSAAGRAGRPTKVFAADAYDERTRLRTVVPLRGRVRRGDSGGPVVNGSGRVVAMMFAASRDGAGGFGIPVSEIRRGLAGALEPVSAGRCLS